MGTLASEDMKQYDQISGWVDRRVDRTAWTVKAMFYQMGVRERKNCEIGWVGEWVGTLASEDMKQYDQISGWVDRRVDRTAWTVKAMFYQMGVRERKNCEIGWVGEWVGTLASEDMKQYDQISGWVDRRVDRTAWTIKSMLLPNENY